MESNPAAAARPQEGEPISNSDEHLPTKRARAESPAQQWPPQDVALRSGTDGTTVQLPMLGCGTFRWSAARAREGVAHALRRGLRLIDTAASYKNEVGVAEAVASVSAAAAIFIVTKVPRDDMSSVSGAAVSASIQRSAEALGRTPLDLVLLHWPGTKNSNPRSPQHRAARITAWRALEAALAEKRVRAIGVSNFTVAHLEQLVADGATIRPAVNQVEVHPYRKQEALRAYCAAHGIHVQAYTSLGRCNTPVKVLYGHKEPDHPRLVDDPAIVACATAEGITVPTLLLKWALQSGLSVVPRASPAHLDENLVGLLERPLRKESMLALDAIPDRDYAFAYPLEKVPL